MHLEIEILFARAPQSMIIKSNVQTTEKQSVKHS
jgi:hypothetical protein